MKTHDEMINLLRVMFVGRAISLDPHNEIIKRRKRTLSEQIGRKAKRHFINVTERKWRESSSSFMASWISHSAMLHECAMNKLLMSNDAPHVEFHLLLSSSVIFPLQTKGKQIRFSLRSRGNEKEMKIMRKRKNRKCNKNQTTYAYTRSHTSETEPNRMFSHALESRHFPIERNGKTKRTNEWILLIKNFYWRHFAIPRKSKKLRRNTKRKRNTISICCDRIYMHFNCRFMRRKMLDISSTGYSMTQKVVAAVEISFSNLNRWWHFFSCLFFLFELILFYFFPLLPFNLTHSYPWLCETLSELALCRRQNHSSKLINESQYEKMKAEKRINEWDQNSRWGRLRPRAGRVSTTKQDDRTTGQNSNNIIFSNINETIYFIYRFVICQCEAINFKKFFFSPFSTSFSVFSSSRLLGCWRFISVNNIRIDYMSCHVRLLMGREEKCRQNQFEKWKWPKKSLSNEFVIGWNSNFPLFSISF